MGAFVHELFVELEEISELVDNKPTLATAWNVLSNKEVPHLEMWRLARILSGEIPSLNLEEMKRAGKRLDEIERNKRELRGEKKGKKEGDGEAEERGLGNGEPLGARRASAGANEMEARDKAPPRAKGKLAGWVASELHEASKIMASLIGRVWEESAGERADLKLRKERKEWWETRCEEERRAMKKEGTQSEHEENMRRWSENRVQLKEKEDERRRIKKESHKGNDESRRVGEMLMHRMNEPRSFREARSARLGVDESGGETLESLREAEERELANWYSNKECSINLINLAREAMKREIEAIRRDRKGGLLNGEVIRNEGLEWESDKEDDLPMEVEEGSESNTNKGPSGSEASLTQETQTSVIMETKEESELMAMDEEGDRWERQSAKRPHPLSASPFALMHAKFAKGAGDDSDTAGGEEKKKGKRRFAGKKRKDKKARAKAQLKDT